MRKIWLMLAVLALATPVLAGTAPARADTPTVTAEDRVLGKADAPVTIIEYASLTCPHCAHFDTETFPKVKKDWIDTGKAKLVFRNFPFDQAALHAAVLARCAPPDRYFAFVDVLFRQQENWETASDPTEALRKIALLGGVGPKEFDACLKDKKITDFIVGQRLQAEKDYGVDSTPTFFINGKKLVGDQPYPEFEKALQAAMLKS